MKKNRCTGSIIFILLCILFVSGIFTGSIYANIFSGAGFIKSISLKETLPQNLPFYSLFIKNSKFFILILLLSFVSFGIPIITALCMLNGIFYGCAVSYIFSLNGTASLKYIIFYIIPFCILKTLPLVISSCFSCWRITKFFSVSRNQKSYLRREKEKNITEFAIVFIISCIIVFFVCHSESGLNIILKDIKF